jgi:hypothetical protein
MAIGSPQTEKFEIGTAEARVGPLTAAMKLTQAHSIGLLDKVAVEANVETAKLEGGFPRRTVAEAIIRETVMVTATVREYSRRNIRLALGYGVEAAPPTDLLQAITAVVAPVALTDGGKVTVADSAGFTDGIVVALYPNNAPEKVVLSKVQGAPALNVITLDVDFPITADILASGCTIMAAREVALGGNSGISYFTMQVIQQEFSTGRPKTFVVWKASVGTGLKWDNNATDFASTDIQFNAIVPTESDTAVGGPLEHVAGFIGTFPYGMFVQGGDA